VNVGVWVVVVGGGTVVVVVVVGGLLVVVVSGGVVVVVVVVDSGVVALVVVVGGLLVVVVDVVAAAAAAIVVGGLLVVVVDAVVFWQPTIEVIKIKLTRIRRKPEYLIFTNAPPLIFSSLGFPIFYLIISLPPSTGIKKIINYQLGIVKILCWTETKS
jgi:hypothetical protein